MRAFEQSFMVSPDDFKAGDRVRYAPGHAHGNMGHPDCQDGIVSSVNDDTVFVRFNSYPEPCSPDSLWKIVG